jgi:hypothetical protein
MLSQSERLLVHHSTLVVLVNEGGLVQRALIPPSTYLARVRLRIETCTQRRSAIACSWVSDHLLPAEPHS